MLTPEQRGLLIEGFNLGLPDPLLAKRLTLSRLQIYKFRKSMNLSAKDVLEKRLDSWAEMVGKGIDLDLIAEMYEVKPTSIRQMLWRERKFSFREAKQGMRESSIAQQTRGLNENAIMLLGQHHHHSPLPVVVERRTGDRRGAKREVEEEGGG